MLMKDARENGSSFVRQIKVQILERGERELIALIKTSRATLCPAGVHTPTVIHRSFPFFLFIFHYYMGTTGKVACRMNTMAIFTKWRYSDTCYSRDDLAWVNNADAYKCQLDLFATQKKREPRSPIIYCCYYTRVCSMAFSPNQLNIDQI